MFCAFFIAPRSRFAGAILCAALISSAWPGSLLAQKTSAADERTSPVPLVAAPPKYPELQPDGSEIFRLAMPNAQSVGLHLEGKKEPFPMTKDAGGNWSVSVRGLAPEYYSYTFRIDGKPGVPSSGTDILDPHNTSVKTSYFVNQSVFLLHDNPPK